MATIEPIKPTDDDRQALRLDPEASQILVDSLLIELEMQAKCVAEETNQAIGNLDRREMHATDVAWKVRRQAVIIDMLEQLRVVR